MTGGESRQAGYRVLVVEDEMLVAMSIEDTLLDAGFEVIGPAFTLQSALKLVAEQQFDAAVLDLNLKGESAAPVADNLAKKSIPFIILSGYGAAIANGHKHAGVISKPFDPDELADAVRGIIA